MIKEVDRRKRNEWNAIWNFREGITDPTARFLLRFSTLHVFTSSLLPDENQIRGVGVRPARLPNRWPVEKNEPLRNEKQTSQILIGHRRPWKERHNRKCEREKERSWKAMIDSTQRRNEHFIWCQRLWRKKHVCLIASICASYLFIMASILAVFVSKRIHWRW